MPRRRTGLRTRHVRAGGRRRDRAGVRRLAAYELGDKSLEVYPVTYPASLDFQTAADGVIDASNKVQATAAECPDTKIVLGGFSQGAAVAGYLTADSVPDGFQMPTGLTGPMPPAIADHVAAVALFGKPSTGFLQMVADPAPPITVGHLYTSKGRSVHSRRPGLLACRRRQQCTQSLPGERADQSGRRLRRRRCRQHPRPPETARSGSRVRRTGPARLDR